ncbi:MAG: hypothetical protein U0236_21730 [Nitrospira sp.]
MPSIPNFDLDLVVEGDGIAFARKLGDATRAQVKVHERFGDSNGAAAGRREARCGHCANRVLRVSHCLAHGGAQFDQEGFYRRDFTINALAVRLNGKGFGDVLDFYGGQRDLHDKRIRVLHGLSFAEDPTRVFRAIRFETRFGFPFGERHGGIDCRRSSK